MPKTQPTFTTTVKVVQGRSGLSRIVRVKNFGPVAPHSLSKAEIAKLNRVYRNIPGALRDKAVAKALAKGRNAVSARIRKEARKSFDVHHYKKAARITVCSRASRARAGGGRSRFGTLASAGREQCTLASCSLGTGSFGAGWNMAGPKRDEAILKELRKNQPEVVDEAWRRGKAGIPASKW